MHQLLPLETSALAIPRRRSHLSGDVLDESLAVAFTLLAGSRPDINEVIALGISLAEHDTFRVVQQREKLGEEALAAFSRELIVHSPQTTAEQRAPVLDVFSWRKPKRSKYD